jgi:hypothetical protein
MWQCKKLPKFNRQDAKSAKKCETVSSAIPPWRCRRLGGSSIQVSREADSSFQRATLGIRVPDREK